MIIEKAICIFGFMKQKNSLIFDYKNEEKMLQQPHLLLVENRFEEFEQKFSSQFLISFGKFEKSI